MKTLTTLCFALTLSLSHSTILAEGLYKWKDARGTIQYGDTPPPNVKAQPVDLPKITIIDNYKDQWKPLNFNNTAPLASTPQVQAQVQTEKASVIYTKLAFLAPKPNQAIRANDGDVSAMISIKPPLKKEHKLIFSINGKATGKSTARTKNFSGLNRGKHTIGVKVVDAQGKTLKSSSVGFNVLRTNALQGNQLNQANTTAKITSYQDARQQQIQSSNQ